MKRLFVCVVLMCGTLLAMATDYHRISSFPIDGASVRDTFLVVVEYAGNTYIWDGQNESGKNYVCLQNYSSDVISGNYADNEVAIVHNQWHSYYKLFSVLCKGDGDREDKGGYYLGGKSGANGISFNAGQVDAEITFEVTEGIKIATKSGVGIFRFNITPNDPHGFKFYQNDVNMLYPTLYVKGSNSRYMTEVTYEDMSEDYTYAQADYYDDKTQTRPTVFNWDFRLCADDDDDAYPQVYLKLTNVSDVAIAGSYASTVANGQPWQVYCTNSSAKSSTYAFVSDYGNLTTLYLKHCTLTLTPVSKDARGVYTYLIDLKWVDQNNKHRKVYKQLPIIGQRTTHVSDYVDDTSVEMFFNEDGSNVENGLEWVESERIGIKVVDRAIVCEEPMRIINLKGQDVTSLNGKLGTGCYIVKCGDRVTKVVVR